MAFFLRARLSFCALLMMAVMFAAVSAGYAAPAMRKTVKPMWDLSDLYQTPDLWSVEYARVKAEVQRLEDYRGTLSSGSAAMLHALSAISTANKDAGRLFTYASLKADEDLSNSANQERKQQAG